MSVRPEETFKIAEQAINSIRTNGVSASPTAYEVWYTHLMGGNPALSKALVSAIEQQSPLSDALTQAIYDQHIQREDVSREVLRASAGISDSVAAIIERLSESGADYKEFADRLKDADSELASISDKQQLERLIATLSGATSAMAERNAALEAQLAQAGEQLETLREDVNRIKEEAYRDGLTGIANRKQFDKTMQEALAARKAEDVPASLIIGDVDHFKSFNDTWGHQIGDQVLKLVATGLSANTKGRDLVARYGGEEFGLILPDTTLANAASLADKLRRDIAARKLTKRATNETIGHVTISFGVAELRPGDSASDVIERADKCLYEAKRRGRNCVVQEDELGL